MRISLSLLSTALLSFSVFLSGAASAQEYKYDASRTALLLVDPFNEFLSEDGRLFQLSKETLEATNAIEHMQSATEAARNAGLKVIYVPHHHYKEGDYSDWKFLSPTQRGSASGMLFRAGTWGVDYHPDLQKQAGDLEAQQQFKA